MGAFGVITMTCSSVATVRAVAGARLAATYTAAVPIDVFQIELLAKGQSRRFRPPTTGGAAATPERGPGDGRRGGAVGLGEGAGVGLSVAEARAWGPGEIKIALGCEGCPERCGGWFGPALMRTNPSAASARPDPLQGPQPAPSALHHDGTIANHRSAPELDCGCAEPRGCAVIRCGDRVTNGGASLGLVANRCVARGCIAMLLSQAPSSSTVV